METQPTTRRLCSEIQLFDLCDLDTCTCKDGRFCTNKEILERFEAIKEEDERSTQFLTEEFDEEEEVDADEELDDSDAYGDDYEDDEQ